jgi:hypothetical protein
MLPRFLSGSAFGIGLTLVLPAFLGGGLGVVDGGSPAFWIKLLGPVVAAGVVTAHLYVKARRQSRRPLGQIVEEADAELAALTAPGWARRVVRQGVWMAAGIGLPVGALLAFGLPAEELPGGSRFLALAGFVVATAGWTVPAAFALRWLALKTHGRQSQRRAGT